MTSKPTLVILLLLWAIVGMAACPTPDFLNRFNTGNDAVDGTDVCGYTGDFSVRNNRTLTIYGDFTITGNWTIYGTLNIEGNITVTGNLTIDGDGELTMTSGSNLNIDGNFTNGGFFSALAVGLGGDPQQGGSSAGTITVGGDFTNNESGDFTISDGGLLNVTGDVTVGAGSTLTIDEGGTLNGNTVTNNGTLNQPSDATCTDGCCGDQCATLPVELVDFNGYFESGAIVINWSTVTEINNDYFEVRKSTNGEDFSVIGIVDGNGDHSGLLEYQFTDYGITSQNNFYQLRQVDFDGQNEIFPTIFIKADDTGGPGTLTVYPNPAVDGQLNLSYSGSVDSNLPRVMLFDMRGNLVMEKTLQQNSQTWQLNQDVGHLLKGVYILKFVNGDDVFTQKLLLNP